MKKLKFTDVVATVIAGLNLISILAGFVLGEATSAWGSFLTTLAGVDLFYVLFGVPFSSFIGITFNIISMVNKKVYSGGSMKINIWIFVAYLAALPGWLYFWERVLLSA